MLIAEQLIDELRRSLESGVHPGDLLEEFLEDLSEEQKHRLIDSLTSAEAAVIVQEMELFDQVALLRLMDPKKASAILREMASDDAVDILGELPPEEADVMLRLVEEEVSGFSGLLRYPEESAGGIMTTEYISLPSDIPAEEAISRLREIAPEAETIYYVYVVDDEGRLIGVLSLRDLIASSDGTMLSAIMRRNIISVNASMDQEAVARVVSKYDLLAVPVVDERNRLLGIITVDDVLDVLEQEATEDIYRLAGTGEVEGVELMEAPPLKVVRRRLPWLMLSMAGGILSGSVIGIFESTLEAIIILAIFIPVIMDMGGSVGTQSSTIFVRGIATGAIGAGEAWRYFFREIRVGLLMGLVTGVLISLAAAAWQGDPYLGLVVGISMTATVTLAAIIGTLVPLICSLARIDPALAAGPFVTTIKDVTGLVIYFGIATLFLDYLRS